MRRVLLAASTALVAAAPATSKRERTVSAVPTGSHRIGNPAAAVKLVEYVSYTCPHCAHFTAEAEPSLSAMVRSGSTSVEYRNQIHDGFDLAAATLARCAGPAAFPRVHAAFYANQAQWIERAMSWAEGNAAGLQGKPQNVVVRTVADGIGLTAIARGAGMPEPRIQTCFATDGAAKQVLAVHQTTAKVRGTPAFEINGKLVEGVDWARLQPMLRAAGAK